MFTHKVQTDWDTNSLAWPLRLLYDLIPYSFISSSLPFLHVHVLH